MATIKLPQPQFDTNFRVGKPKDQSELIMQVLGQNPFASAINEVSPQISDALAKRAELRRQAQVVAALQSAAQGNDNGQPLPSGTTPENFQNLLKIKTDRSAKEAEAAKSRVELELKLEQLRKGYEETDPTGTRRTYPGVQGLNITYDQNGNPQILRTPEYKPAILPKSKNSGSGGKSGDPLKELQNDLDPAYPRSGMAKLFERTNSADRVLTLLDQSGGNPNALQSSEAAAAVASLVTSGSSGRIAQEQLNHLTPQSFRGDIMKQIGYIANEPVSLGQQEFFKSLRDTAIREKSVTQDQIKKTQLQRLGRHQNTKLLFPESYNAILSNYGITPGESLKTIKPSAPFSIDKNALDAELQRRGLQ